MATTTHCDISFIHKTDLRTSPFWFHRALKFDPGKIRLGRNNNK